MRFGWTALALAASLTATAAPAQNFDPMARADTDKDGKVSLDEYKALAEARWGRLTNGADKIAIATADDRAKRALASIAPDADGNVTHAAFSAAQPEAFKKADTNGDGALDAAELTAAMPMRRPQPQQ